MRKNENQMLELASKNLVSESYLLRCPRTARLLFINIWLSAADNLIFTCHNTGIKITYIVFRICTFSRLHRF